MKDAHRLILIGMFLTVGMMLAYLKDEIAAWFFLIAIFMVFA